MIYEVHGDTCRLGYLKIIAALVSDMEVRTPDFLASILFEIAHSAAYPKHDALGLIRSRENAVNYVALATDLNIVRRDLWTAGETTLIYSSLESSKPVYESVSVGGPKILDVLELTSTERIFLLNTLLLHDFHMMAGVIGWALEHGRFTRSQAMEECMETVYPAALRKELKEARGKMRMKIQRKIEAADVFAENRMRYASKSEWVRSRQYAIYRHTLPPRLEWLVDLGILRREGRGKYCLTREAVSFSRELRIIISEGRERVEEAVYTYLAKPLLGCSSPDRSQVMEALLNTYSWLQSRVRIPISLDLLRRVTSYRLLERGVAASPYQVGRVFNNLAIMFPDRVFVKPGHDGVTEVTRLEVTPSEIDTTTS